ncbi:CFF_collapsed_G0013860.mRNA.1.CDS.1 [Saccharomyces cerevisiae]|nr:CFF_collapsed_G0013860.mRNA.1.CDS.1 [Saccharomyces cerevisiae]
MFIVERPYQHRQECRPMRHFRWGNSQRNLFTQVHSLDLIHICSSTVDDACPNCSLTYCGPCSSSARHGTQTLKNPNFLERFPQRPYRLFASHSSRHFSRLAFKVLQHLYCGKLGSLACLLSNFQYTNCFSSSSNGQVPSIISLYLRVDLSLFTLKISNTLTGSPMIWLDVFQVFFVFLVTFAAFSPQLVLPKPSSDTILFSRQPNRHRARTAFDSPCIIRIV